MKSPDIQRAIQSPWVRVGEAIGSAAGVAAVLAACSAGPASPNTAPTSHGTVPVATASKAPKGSATPTESNRPTARPTAGSVSELQLFRTAEADLMADSNGCTEIPKSRVTRTEVGGGLPGEETRIFYVGGLVAKCNVFFGPGGPPPNDEMSVDDNVTYDTGQGFEFEAYQNGSGAITKIEVSKPISGVQQPGQPVVLRPVSGVAESAGVADFVYGVNSAIEFAQHNSTSQPNPGLVVTPAA